VGKSKDKKKDMSKVKCFACHKTEHYASQCPNKKKKKEPEVSASAEVIEFTEKFEREFSLITGLSSSGSAEFGDIGVWFVDNGASRHMTGMRFVFLSFSEINSNCYVGCGASTRHAVKGVGCVRFQLESGGFLELVEVLLVPELPVYLLSMSTLEVDGCEVVFFRGLVFVYLEGATPNTAIFLVSSMRGYTSCWDILWLDPMDSWIRNLCQCQRVSRLLGRVS
jgi:hypothetical protein